MTPEEKSKRAYECMLKWKAAYHEKIAKRNELHLKNNKRREINPDKVRSAMRAYYLAHVEKIAKLELSRANATRKNSSILSRIYRSLCNIINAIIYRKCSYDTRRKARA
jgi:hypothetical protein